MNEIISMIHSEKGDILVSGRELHEYLEIGTQYSKWFCRMTEYGFEHGIDYLTVSQKRITVQGNETTFNDHHIKLDMAKEIAMIQRSDKGKQARKYFLEIERKWNSPEMIIKRAHEFLEKRVAELKMDKLVLAQQINELKPKASYYDVVLQSKSLLSISKIAKDYGMSGTKMNKLLHELGIQFKQGNCWLLYQKYADKGYTQSKTHVIDSDKSKLHTYWTQKGRLFIYETLKNKKSILPIIEQEERAS
ncbi:phage antirepressor KilAC domain-containing protein [Bacillus atrophaeus]|uniref:phage antirepressor KilAC domain-containing protein n=1 Tax=Bacillus atrophaeus TaxID=1452 RepID=UPI00227DE25B|nr:phage antirepressor KilAC domain-containing protein [Bacillus atrophaeus]MCY8913169.1 phage antirepressor KilAC domain-containing protein [Bacillus atrophaeus]MCY9114683.1 phage antirepressor KilAC domain-containing protein [Bacillus atrophaeus]MEC0924179.1 phage antirepressor KilAC domain-containing protein [Bacillus atrophaeus]MEC0932790.1 phage antirepressor KilAC domain-containing protein [Bacillus atrophaeus]